MKKNAFSNVTYVNLVRYWLSSVLLLLPFQNRIAKTITLWGNTKLSFIQYIDEVTIIVFFPLAIAEFIRNKEIRDSSYIILSFPMMVLFVVGLISGIVNGNPLHITFLGTLDYIRYFLVIFIFAAFFREVSEYKKIFHMVLAVAVLIGVIAFIQELWAICSFYFFEEYSGSKIYIMLNSLLPDYSHYFVRFGIYRVKSLMDNFNFMGLYILLILTIYSFTAKKVKIPLVMALLPGILFSVSRMAYSGLLFVSGVHLLNNKKKRILILLAMSPILFFMFKLSILWDFNILGLRNVSESGSYISESEINVTSFRAYSKDKAMEIWKDQPLLGVGPGMFGAIISVKLKSHIYELYDFNIAAKNILFKWKSIDQFWPIVIAETGIIGTAVFAALFISVFAILFLSKKRTDSEEIKGLFTGLKVFQIVILIYSLGNVINITLVIFPFFAFVGMGLGSLKVNRI